MKPSTRLLLIHLGLFPTDAAFLPVHRAHASSQAPLDRIEAFSQIEILNNRLLGSNSATATLEQWCADHCMAKPAKIVVRRLLGPEKAPDPETRRRLKAENGEAIRYRHVELLCGKHVLSEADNWYVPARLTAEANIMLETGDTPFGKAIRSLSPSRSTISSKILWSPAPRSQEMRAPPPQGVDVPLPETSDPPRYLLEPRALILTKDKTPVSEVDERYTRQLLDFEECDGQGPARP